MKRPVAALLAAGALLCAGAANAKDFDPGDLRLCNAARCVAVGDRPLLRMLGSFYYTGPQPPAAPAPRLGAPALQLRFSNGYVTGIVATAAFDRFLSYGVYLGRFRRGTWYRLPAGAAADLRKLAAGLTPLRVTRAALARSR